MSIKEEFNRYALNYNKYSFIQNKIAKILVDNIDFKIENVVDLGCGNGKIFNCFMDKNIHFKKFYAVDFAKNMIDLHPDNPKVEKIRGDFNKLELFNILSKKNIDLTVSSSALQWAKDLDFTFYQISKISKYGLFFLFTSNTFKTLHKTVGVKSPIYDKETILNAFNKSFVAKKIELYNFNLNFKNTLEMLKYIKKSGVGGGLEIGYKNLKFLINNYSKSYLEFETILLKGESK